MEKEHELASLTAREVLDMTLRRIDSMAEHEADEGTLPYTSGRRKTPYNAVSGREILDINGTGLELYAAMLDTASATIVEGCCAQLIGLELDGYEGPIREDFAEYGGSGIMDGSTYEAVKARKTLPYLMMVNVTDGDGKPRVEYMYVYFIDQFTTESLARAAQMLGKVAGGGE